MEKITCRRCVLDADVPGITIRPETGLCQLCEQHDALSEENRADRLAQMNTLLTTHKGPGKYDAIFALSGGKDSCFTLYQLKNRYPDLRILAVLFDNTFISARAVENARKFCTLAGCDFEIYSVDEKYLFDAFKKAAESKDIFPPSARNRASDICNTCISIVKQKLMERTLTHRAPFLIFAFTPGQVSEAIIILPPKFISWSREIFAAQLEKMAITDSEEHFLMKKTSIAQARERGNVTILHPLCVWEYSEEHCRKTCMEFGWVPPDLQDANSTNCLLNSFAIENHRKKYGFHPYACDIAGLVRNQLMDRKEGMAILQSGVSAALVENAIAKLKITRFL